MTVLYGALLDASVAAGDAAAVVDDAVVAEAVAVVAVFAADAGPECD